MLGFLTREFTVDTGQGAEPMVAVYVPTNHLYLGDVRIVRRAAARFPDITVEEGVRIFLTGGVALPRGCPGEPGRRGARRRREAGGVRLQGRGVMDFVQCGSKRGGLSGALGARADGRGSHRCCSPPRCWSRAAALAAQPVAPQETVQGAPPVAQRHGGEASLVLPDLGSVTFLGVDGRTLLTAGWSFRRSACSSGW